VVVLESTTYPVTTEEIVIQEFPSRGFQIGTDFFLGYSPERIDPGNPDWNISTTPKVVSGPTRLCLEATVALYSTIVEKLVPVSNVRSEEITKLFENIFRGVNIAPGKRVQTICDEFDIDVWEVIQACSSKPYGFVAFYPGPRLGAHCVPVDPFYLGVVSTRVSTTFGAYSHTTDQSMDP
jgi:UDP-N-acetyl-D-glucosamine dehydrogenase